MKTSVIVCLALLAVACAVRVEPARQQRFLEVLVADGPVPAVPAVPGAVAPNATVPPAVPAAANVTAGGTCPASPCQNSGVCTNETCACPAGFSGSLCEVNQCTGVVCPFGSNCIAGKCEVDRCAKVNCQNGGTCTNGICTCVNSFTGGFCERHPCDAVKCLNDGICKVPGQCYCLNGFYGQFCEQSPCANVACMNGGKCAFGQCVCNPEWSGERCERPSEAARDYKIYVDNLNKIADQVQDVGRRMELVHNVTSPKFINGVMKTLINDIQTNVVQAAQEESKKDFMTPRVIGVKPVTHKDMRMPNSPFENAKIYEDKDLAYQKAREVKDLKLKDALTVVDKYDVQHLLDATVIAKDVPGAEYFKGPFGGFTQVKEKYVGQDESLLEADLEAYHKDNERTQELIFGGEE